MLKRLETWRGHRVKIYTLDQGEAVGTLGEIAYLVEREPVSVELRDPDDISTDLVVIPWCSIAGLHLEETREQGHPFGFGQEADEKQIPE